MALATLTDPDGKPVYVNPAAVMVVQSNGGRGATVFFVGQSINRITVTETADAVAGLLKAAV